MIHLNCTNNFPVEFYREKYVFKSYLQTKLRFHPDSSAYSGLTDPASVVSLLLSVPELVPALGLVPVLKLIPESLLALESALVL